MKILVLFLSFLFCSNTIVAQIWGKPSVADVIKGNSNTGLYDYVQEKGISAPLFAYRYGDRFLKDCQSIKKSMRYASKESNESFQEAIKTRQFMIEKNREEWNRLRDINMRYLKSGKALITLSTISAAIAIPVICKTMTDDALDYLNGSESYNTAMNKISKRTKGVIITSVVCSIGELVGISCIIRYRNHRDEYDPPFYFTPVLNEESIGFSFMKNF